MTVSWGYSRGDTSPGRFYIILRAGSYLADGWGSCVLKSCVSNCSSIAPPLVCVRGGMLAPPALLHVQCDVITLPFSPRCRLGPSSVNFSFFSTSRFCCVFFCCCCFSSSFQHAVSLVVVVWSEYLYASDIYNLRRLHISCYFKYYNQLCCKYSLSQFIFK